MVLAESERALPLIREAYRSADDEATRLAYAKALAVLGDDEGSETLMDEVRKAMGLGYR